MEITEQFAGVALPGIELRFSGLVASAFTYSLAHRRVFNSVSNLIHFLEYLKEMFHKYILSDTEEIAQSVKG